MHKQGDHRFTTSTNVPITTSNRTRSKGTMSLQHVASEVLAVLPHGRTLPADQWHARHRATVRATWALSIVLAAFMVTWGSTLAHAGLEAAVPAAAAGVACCSRLSQRVRASLVALALMSASAIAVHASGTIEAHFLFFIAIPVVALYEDWAPFVVSVVAVLVHHLITGLRDPSALYNHDAALQAPIQWGLIHTGLLLTMCAVSIAHWRIHERARAALARQALHDALTGLPNRTLLLDRLDQALQDSVRTETPVALLMVDLDGFKPVNDTFGHLTGDALLRKIADRLRAGVRAGDTPSRFGGDEFALLLPRTTSDQAVEAAERLIAAIAAPIVIDGTSLTVGASVGVAAVSHGTSVTVRQLIGQADLAMLAAKRNGRGTHAVHRPDLARTGPEPVLRRRVTDPHRLDVDLPIPRRPTGGLPVDGADSSSAS